MQVQLINIAKRFNKQWLFKGITETFEPKKSYAITGNNGSGKSTLLQIIYGAQTFSKGELHYRLAGDEVVPDEEAYQHIAFAAPYMELIETFTLEESWNFHFSMKPRVEGVNMHDAFEEAGLKGSAEKQLKHFSSGMKQRLKLLLAFYSNTPLLLLDEPTSNLDEQGMNWYKEMVLKANGNRTLLIASNQEFEIDFCDTRLLINNFK